MATRVGLEDVCKHATRRGVEEDTRMSPDQLQYLANKYAYVVPQRQRSTWKRGLYFYCYFMFLQMGLSPDVQEHWAGLQNAGDDWHGVSPRCFRDNVLPIGEALAAVINEIVYDDRCAAPHASAASSYQPCTPRRRAAARSAITAFSHAPHPPPSPRGVGFWLDLICTLLLRAGWTITTTTHRGTTT